MSNARQRIIEFICTATPEKLDKFLNHPEVVAIMKQYEAGEFAKDNTKKGGVHKETEAAAHAMTQN